MAGKKAPIPPGRKGAKPNPFAGKETMKEERKEMKQMPAFKAGGKVKKGC